MEQHGDKQRPFGIDLLDHPAGERIFIDELARRDLVQDADRAQGMLVNGIDVVHVILHLRHDPCPVGQELAEHAGIVHQRQRRFRRWVGEYLEEDGIGLGIVTQLPPDHREVAGHGLQRLGMDLLLLALGHPEHAQHIDRLLSEMPGSGQAQPAAIDRKTIDGIGPDRPTDPGHRVILCLFLIERGDDPAERTHLFHHQEIMLHEPLDPERIAVIHIAEAAADFRLQVKGQPILAASGQVVQMRPHRPEEVLRPVKGLGLRLTQFTEADKVMDLIHLMHIFGDPEQHVQIAQGTEAVLDVRFEHIAGVTHLVVTLVTLTQLGGYESLG